MQSYVAYDSTCFYSSSLTINFLSTVTDLFCLQKPSLQTRYAAQQKRNLSIHEYLSADLLKSVSRLTNPDTHQF